MICPTCRSEGERSEVRSEGTTTTAMMVDSFYDEDGKRHVHDMNERSTSYSCSRGHEWMESSQNRCWCGWGAERAGIVG